MRCVLAAAGLLGYSEPVRTSTAVSSPLLALWVAVGAVVWVCPELEAGQDGKTSLATRWGGGAPHHGPEGEQGIDRMGRGL